jgi:hypothetical protein
MISNVNEYLSQLRKELADCDRATIQDALSDAEEHLRNSIDSARENKPDIPEIDALGPIVQEYGTPSEIAAVYREIESRVGPSLAPLKKPEKRSWFLRFFGVVADPRAYGAFFYLIFSLALGIIYFTWAITGLSLSAGLIILIFGVLFFGVFMLSVRGISLIEGRLIEALLGIRMPRRPFFTSKDRGLWPKFKSLVSDKYTWFSLIYMIIMLPLGIIYFTVFVTLIALSLWFVAFPILQLGFGLPMFTNYGSLYYLNGWVMPIVVVVGILLFVLTLHLAKFTGNMHGKLAKAMLVRE